MRCRFTAMRVACEACYLVYGAPIINEEFDGFQSGTRPSGWTFTNCNSDSDTYTSTGQYGLTAPSIKLDASGDAITTAAFAGPEKLSFWLKGISLSGTTDALLVEEHYGGSWTTVTNIKDISSNETVAGPFVIASSSNQLRFTYNQTSSGNLAVDDIRLLGITPTPTPAGYHTPVTTPTSAPATATPTAYNPPASATPTAYNPPASATPTAAAAIEFSGLINIFYGNSDMINFFQHSSLHLRSRQELNLFTVTANLVRQKSHPPHPSG